MLLLVVLLKKSRFNALNSLILRSHDISTLELIYSQAGAVDTKEKLEMSEKILKTQE